MHFNMFKSVSTVIDSEYFGIHVAHWLKNERKFQKNPCSFLISNIRSLNLKFMI